MTSLFRVFVILFALPGYALGGDCPAAGEMQVEIHLSVPADNEVSSVTVDLSYPKDRLAIPGERNQDSVKQRLSGFPPEAITAFNDQNGLLRVVIAGTNKLASAKLFEVELDTCQGVPPAVSELSCKVAGCAGKNGKVLGCSCSMQPVKRQ